MRFVIFMLCYLTLLLFATCDSNVEYDDVKIVKGFANQYYMTLTTDFVLLNAPELDSLSSRGYNLICYIYGSSSKGEQKLIWYFSRTDVQQYEYKCIITNDLLSAYQLGITRRDSIWCLVNGLPWLREMITNIPNVKDSELVWVWYFRKPIVKQVEMPFKNKDVTIRLASNIIF